MLDLIGSSTSCLNVSGRSSTQARIVFGIDKNGGCEQLPQGSMGEN
jgi:hypothetical protein